MRIRLAIPDRIINEDILNAALEATTRANQQLMMAGEAPAIEEAIRDGLRWKPENFGDGEHFDLAPVAAVRGWGDCDDLAPWLAAERRIQGDTGAVAFARRSGPNKFHALVRSGDGEIIDPSVWAGMKARKGIPPSITGTIACAGEGAIAVVPHRGGYAARCDLPWGARHWSGLSLASTPEIAVQRAAQGSVLVGEAMGVIGEDDVDALSYMLNGICGDASEAEVGSFLDALGSIASTVAPVASLIPGVGPIAAAALPVAGSLLSSLTGGKKGPAAGPPPPPPAASTQSVPTLGMPGGMQSMPMPGGGHIAYNPSNPGPIIVRF